MPAAKKLLIAKFPYVNWTYHDPTYIDAEAHKVGNIKFISSNDNLI